MVFGYRFTKKSVALLIVLALTVASMGIIAVLCDKSDGVSALAEDAFVKEDEVVFAHITDTHYYPAAYCGDITETDTGYYDFMASSMKMVIEAAPYNVAALESIVEELPDYLVVTGDMTLNGEMQGHIEMANLLRQLQERVRAAGKPGFQVFVAFGNHDMYNDEAYSYRSNEETFVKNVTRADVVKIYSSLGYPDLTDEEIAEYYASLITDGYELYADRAPYDESMVSDCVSALPFVNSTTADNVDAKWLYVENGQQARMEAGEITDYDYGDISAIFTLPEGYNVIIVDEELSNTEQQHHLGAVLFDSVSEWLDGEAAAGTFDGNTLVAIQHHNVLPHFTGEETLLKDFTVYNYAETADYMADLGIRYVFSGHMHSNDAVSRVSLNGNLLTDIETSSVTGYRGAVRYAAISRGKVGEKAAENLEMKLELLKSVDFGSLFAEGLIDDEYVERFGLEEYLSGKVVTDPSGYAASKLFLNIIENVVYGSFINVEFIGGLGDMVASLLPESTGTAILDNLLDSVRPAAGQLVNNLIAHIEDKVLADYEYGGNRAEFKSDARGAKIGGYLDELIQKAAFMPLNAAGDTLFDFVMGAYLDHVGGTDRPYAEATADQKEAFAGLKNGSSIKKLVDILLDENTGLYRIVMGLFQPIDLAEGVDSKTVGLLETLISTLLVIEMPLDEFNLDSASLLEKLFVFLKGMGLDLGFDLKGMSGKEFLNDVLDSYVTDALYTSLGEIAYGIVYAFMIDEDAPMENSVGEYKLYQSDASLAASWIEGEIDNTPTVERGMLPSQLTVTFGEDPMSTKNFVWFTDDAITGTQIQYNEGTTFDLSKAVTVDGTFEKYATTTANIDLGIYATLMQIEVMRHSVSLTGLKSGTVYSYRVGSAQNGYWSATYTFATAPGEGTPFEALLMTDIQGSGMNPYETASEIMEGIGSQGIFRDGFDFVLNTGDVVDNDRNWVQWGYYLGYMQDYWANTTSVVANGNHDKHFYEGIDEEDIAEVAEYMWLDDSVQDEYNYLLLHFGIDYPQQDASTGAYYSFDYSDVHFTVLNTNNLDQYTEALSGEQTLWLENDLKSTDKKYKVVIMHKSLYSAGSHIDDGDVKALRKQLTPIFADNGVCLVLSGHDHTYSESYYIDRNGNAMDVSADATTELGTVEGGVLYVSMGTFGDKFYNYRSDEDIPLQYGEKLHDPALSNPTFGKLSYDGEKLWYTGYQYDLETGRITEIHACMSELERIIVIVAVAVAALIVVVAVAAAIGRGVKVRKK